MELQKIEVIDINVFIKDGVVVRAESSGNKLRGFERSFIGKNFSELIDIVPRTLATCSQAHIYALTKNMKGFEKTRALLLKLEIVESHLKHPYIYWFPNLDLGKDYDFPQGSKYRRIIYCSKLIRNLMEKIAGKFPHNSYLKDKRDIYFKKEELSEILQIIEKEVFGMSLNEFLELEDFEELKGDVRLLYDKAKDLLYFTSGIRNYLVVGFPFVSSFDYSKLCDYGTEIEYEGKKVEVGPLAQALTFDPLVKKYYSKIGPSPLLREIARMRIIAKLLTSLEDFFEFGDLEEIQDGEFINTVESIRGSLIHHFEIKNKLVKYYKIIQPTSIIASRGGALEKAIEGLRINNVKNPVELTLVVSSLDTCFVSRVRLIQDGKIVSEKRIGGLC
ncbi:MAG: nickel-dependent hydrogenase large subunit [Sulfolobaceae archaeon]